MKFSISRNPRQIFIYIGKGFGPIFYILKFFAILLSSVPNFYNIRFSKEYQILVLTIQIVFASEQETRGRCASVCAHGRLPIFVPNIKFPFKKYYVQIMYKLISSCLISFRSLVLNTVFGVTTFSTEIHTNNTKTGRLCYIR